MMHVWVAAAHVGKGHVQNISVVGGLISVKAWAPLPTATSFPFSILIQKTQFLGIAVKIASLLRTTITMANVDKYSKK